MANKNKEQEQTLDLSDTERNNQTNVIKESETTKQNQVTENSRTTKSGIFAAFLLTVIVGILIVSNIWLFAQVKQLNHAIQYTYVYNMEAVLMQTGLADENRKFESNMADLEKEIDAAEKKVKSMKDKKLQQEYREMYMKSLTLKRDTLIEEHEKFMKILLKNINKTLAEVAKDNDVKVVFNNKAIVFSTSFVTDITQVVAKKLKQKMED